jgi:hypothetical protein
VEFDGGDYSYAKGETLGFSAFLLGGSEAQTAARLQSFSVQSGVHGST